MHFNINNHFDAFYQKLIIKQKPTEDLQIEAEELGVALNKLYINNTLSALYYFKGRTIHYSHILASKARRRAVTKIIKTNSHRIAYGKLVNTFFSCSSSN